MVEMDDCGLIIKTHDGAEVRLPAHLINQFNTLEEYLKAFGNDTIGKKFEIPCTAPFTNKSDLDIMLDFAKEKAKNDKDEKGQEEASAMNEQNFDWENEFFEAYERRQLIKTESAASFLGAISFVRALARHFFDKITHMKTVDEAAEFFREDFDGELRDRLGDWMKENREVDKKQAAKDKEERDAAEAAQKKMEEEEQQRIADEPGSDDEDDYCGWDT